MAPSAFSAAEALWRTRDKHEVQRVQCVSLYASDNSIVFPRQQDHELSGIRGIPVEGHDIVTGIEIKGTKELLLSGSGWRTLRERLRANGAELRLGWPLETQTLCRFQEVVRDVMNEKGFPRRGDQL